jgi:hypothetical protein
MVAAVVALVGGVYTPNNTGVPAPTTATATATATTTTESG